MGMVGIRRVAQTKISIFVCVAKQQDVIPRKFDDIIRLVIAC